MTLDVPSLSTTSRGAGTASNILRAIRGLGGDDAGGDTAAVISPADICAAFQLEPAEERALISALRAAAREAPSPLVRDASDFWLLACLRARKADVPRALALAQNYFAWRQTVDADHVTPATSACMRRQLQRGILFVAGNRDRAGRPVLSLRMSMQDPATFSAADTTRMISFVLEWMLRTIPAAQTHGIVIVNDFEGVAFRNLDVRMPGVLQRAFSRTVPVRLAAMNVVNPPAFFRALFAIVAPILSAKLKARMRLFTGRDVQAFQELFAPDEIIKDLGMGGTREWTQEMQSEWVDRLVKDCQTWAPSASS